jgi:hypothetical protein
VRKKILSGAGVCVRDGDAGENDGVSFCCLRMETADWFGIGIGR